MWVHVQSTYLSMLEKRWIWGQLKGTGRAYEKVEFTRSKAGKYFYILWYVQFAISVINSRMDSILRNVNFQRKTMKNTDQLKIKRNQHD